MSRLDWLMVFLTLFLANLKFEVMVDDLFFVSYIMVFLGVLEEPSYLLAADGVTLAPLPFLPSSGLMNSCLPLDDDATSEGDPLRLFGLGEIMNPTNDESLRFFICEPLFIIGMPCRPFPGDSATSFRALGEMMPIL